jgi:rare lipoprotein A
MAFSLAALALPNGAKADQLPAHSAGNAIDRMATLSRQFAQMAALATVTPAVSPAAVATPAPGRHASEAATKKTRGDETAARQHGDRLAEKSKRHDDKAAAAETLCVRAIGKAETGTAAWYGGRYIGRRTSSGSRLDTMHATAAHRTLPLNSLARVTNLKNGRSVIVRVTDRGPISESLLIDMSPRAATELDMKQAGLIPVSVEQVVEVPSDPK